MTSLITPAQLEKVIPNNKEINEWCQALNAILPLYSIDTPVRISAFLAQCAHESGGFSRLSENLNYSEKGLLTTFGKRFSPQEAKAYARQPERIANHAYANRNGNSDEASGDGWRYRGGGLIQLTGKSNYKLFADAVKKDLKDVPDYVRTKTGAVESAAWFWKTNGLNRYADARDIKGLTKRINGGTLGLDERIALYDKARATLNA